MAPVRLPVGRQIVRYDRLGTAGHARPVAQPGQQQRVNVARTLMHEPDVLFLDEPTNNLDPQSRLFFWERIRDGADRGVTIVLSTQDMEEADRLCDRIAIMDHGRILALDTPEALKGLVPGGTMLDLRARVAEGIALAPALGDASSSSSQVRVPGALTRQRRQVLLESGAELTGRLLSVGRAALLSSDHLQTGAAARPTWMFSWQGRHVTSVLRRLLAMR